MDQQQDFNTRVNIGDRDSLGKTIDLRLIAAAQAVWERACLLVIRYLGEDTEAPDILEAVVDAASRAMANNQPIEHFDAYLLKGVARESLRRRRKNQGPHADRDGRDWVDGSAHTESRAGRDFPLKCMAQLRRYASIARCISALIREREKPDGRRSTMA